MVITLIQQFHGHLGKILAGRSSATTLWEFKSQLITARSLIANAVLELPDAKGGEEEAFGAAERPDGR
jgi:hypothetical protein